MRSRCISFLAVLLFGPAALFGTDIIFWHAFEGFLYEKFAEIVDDFNYQSKDYRIQLVYKGNYKETFDKGVEAFEQGSGAPHILQVYEVATQTLCAKPEMFIPADRLLCKYFKKFDPAVYIDAVRDFYSNAKGEMFSLPWNASTGILFYNKEIFQQVGLDPSKPPKTWEDLEKYGVKFVNAGYRGFTTAWPAAYHLEYICSWHNLPFATEENGFLGPSAPFEFQRPMPDPPFAKARRLAKIRHLQLPGALYE